MSFQVYNSIEESAETANAVNEAKGEELIFGVEVIGMTAHLTAWGKFFQARIFT